jgi:hypothetical protein
MMGVISEVLLRAAERVERGWCQRDTAQTADGERTTSNSPRAVRWCAAGAVFGQAAPDDNCWKAVTVLREFLRVDSLSQWNDAPGRTAAEVAAAMRTAAEWVAEREASSLQLDEHCPVCEVEIGQLHRRGCCNEDCSYCGLQLFSCGHITPEDERMPWTGRRAMETAAIEMGWYAKLTQVVGWVPCEQHELGAWPDCNRVVMDLVWDRARKEFVRVV